MKSRMILGLMAPFPEMRGRDCDKEEEGVEFGPVGCEMPDRLKSTDVERAL